LCWSADAAAIGAVASDKAAIELATAMVRRLIEFLLDERLG
jgi:hypothetical protein